MSSKKKYKGLRLILGDQLNRQHSWFKEKDWLYVMMEIKSESEYVTHHIQKIVGIFHAMRTFASDLWAKGFDLVYIKISDSDNEHDFEKNIKRLLDQHHLELFQYQEPDEWRLDQILKSIPSGEAYSTEHFLTDRSAFEGKETFLMESFYRKMRKKYDVLMDGAGPLTGKWNYDKSNRKKLPTKLQVPDPIVFEHDVSEIFHEIKAAGISYVGRIDPKKFIWPKDRDEVLEVFEYFIENLLANFGDYQDAMTEDYWSVYHSRISFGMNLKMLSPLEVIRRVEMRYHSNPDLGINTVEGFIRQILGWREYMRALYWVQMPEYKQLNYFSNEEKLPNFYWTGETGMNCLSHAIKQSLDYSYAHHIQRLMITGNFALLAGVHPDEVDLWYLGIYIDAFEWVEITNTRGMSQYADGGIVATKPYVSSASYINKMGSYCKNCKYDHKKKTGEGACPFNSLYWHFIDKHMEKLEKNQRMSMILSVWKKMSAEKQSEYLKQAKNYLETIETL